MASPPISSSTRRKRHTFAPVGQQPRSKDEMELKGVIFDMDGTLCTSHPLHVTKPSYLPLTSFDQKGLPQNHMFREMRVACSIPASEDILDYIHSLPAQEQKDAFEKIQTIERKAMGEQVPQAGLVHLMDFLDRWGLRKGICTRNFDAPVTHLLSHHIPSHISPFSPIITRDFRPPKPSPAGILHIAHAWGITSSADLPSLPREGRLLPLVMVGDSVDDMAAGHEAGALTVLLRSEGKEGLERDERTDVVVSRLDELVDLLEKGLSSSRT